MEELPEGLAELPSSQRLESHHSIFAGKMNRLSNDSKTISKCLNMDSKLQSKDRLPRSLKRSEQSENNTNAWYDLENHRPR